MLIVMYYQNDNHLKTWFVWWKQNCFVPFNFGFWFHLLDLALYSTRKHHQTRHSNFSYLLSDTWTWRYLRKCFGTCRINPASLSLFKVLQSRISRLVNVWDQISMGDLTAERRKKKKKDLTVNRRFHTWSGWREARRLTVQDFEVEWQACRSCGPHFYCRN